MTTSEDRAAWVAELSLAVETLAAWVDHAGELYALARGGRIFRWNLETARWDVHVTIEPDYLRQWWTSYRAAEHKGEPACREVIYETRDLAQIAPEAFPGAVITVEQGDPHGPILPELYPAPDVLHRSTYPLAPPKG